MKEDKHHHNDKKDRNAKQKPKSKQRPQKATCPQTPHRPRVLAPGGGVGWGWGVLSHKLRTSCSMSSPSSSKWEQ